MTTNKQHECTPSLRIDPATKTWKCETCGTLYWPYAPESSGDRGPATMSVTDEKWVRSDVSVLIVREGRRDMLFAPVPQTFDGQQEARAKLAASAPQMARALLAARAALGGGRADGRDAAMNLMKEALEAAGLR